MVGNSCDFQFFCSIHVQFTFTDGRELTDAFILHLRARDNVDRAMSLLNVGEEYARVILLFASNQRALAGLEQPAAHLVQRPQHLLRVGGGRAAPERQGHGCASSLAPAVPSRGLCCVGGYCSLSLRRGIESRGTDGERSRASDHRPSTVIPRG